MRTGERTALVEDEQYLYGCESEDRKKGWVVGWVRDKKELKWQGCSWYRDVKDLQTSLFDWSL